MDDNFIKMCLQEYKKEYGDEAKIEEGEEFATVFNDGVVIIGLEDKNISIKVLAGKPYFVDQNLNLVE